MNIAFGSKNMIAPLTSKEKLVQFVTDPKNTLSGMQVPYEASVNRTLAQSHILTDDEYKMMDKGGY